MKKALLVIFGLFLLAGLSFGANTSIIVNWTGTCLDCLAGPGGSAGSGVDNGNPSQATATLEFLELENGPSSGATLVTGGNLIGFSYTSDFLGTLVATSVVGELGKLAGGTLVPLDNSVGFDIKVRFSAGSSEYRFNAGADGAWSLVDLTPPPCPGCGPGGARDFGINSTFSVPEPATFALLALGGLAGIGFGRRRAA